MEEFTYIYIDNFLYNSLYINLDQRLIFLIYFLFFKGKPFGFLERETKIQFINFFRPIVRLLRVMEFTYLYNKKKRINKKTPGTFPTLSSSHYGNCLILGGEGEFKIINFRKNSVISAFPDSFPSNVMKDRIYKLKEAQKCKLSPNLLAWNINGRYMEESYLNLKPIQLNDLKSVHLVTLPILGDILLSTNHQVISLGQHIQNVSKKIEQLISPFLNENLNLVNNIKNILEFISEISKVLKKNSSTAEIILGFSHGDFWEGNILKGKKISRVIDWNTLEIRSAFFDFYFISFDKIKNFNVNEANIHETSREIEEAFQTFIHHYLEDDFINSKLTANIVNQSDVYRLIFYLEYILQKLKENPAGEQKYFEYLINRIKFFQIYESKIYGNNFNNYLVESI